MRPGNLLRVGVEGMDCVMKEQTAEKTVSEKMSLTIHRSWVKR